VRQIIGIAAAPLDLANNLKRRSGGPEINFQGFRWWEEFRLYHRKDGKVVKEGDDLMCATRYALMMMRLASTAQTYRNFRRKLVYPKQSIA
jgi:hypothetical protein